MRTYNLTVNDLHTFYVLAGSTPILVHNAGAGVCDLFHGTDLASAQNIVRNGLNANAARALGGGDVFWTTTNQADAELFAQVNPALSENTGVVGIRIQGGIEAGVRSGVLQEVPQLPGAFTVADWAGLNKIATYELVSSTGG
ncbi:hypothetical protein [Kutzneria sp. NPDC052558]|uniref:hypothetical protein n=1 Tax=Kutzneria sp. NPDC052558 TaxID=3364121 RepID=UPI0037CA6BBA